MSGKKEFLPVNDPNLLTLIWACAAIVLPLIPCLILFKLLPENHAVGEGQVYKYKFKLGGAIAAFFPLFLILFFGLRPPVVGYEVWTVRGSVVDDRGAVPPTHLLSFKVEPSARYDGDGTFEIDYPLRRGQFGDERFPTLMVDFAPMSSFPYKEVLDPNSKSTRLIFNREKHRIDLKPITLKSRPEIPYQAAQSQTASLEQPVSPAAAPFPNEP